MSSKALQRENLERASVDTTPWNHPFLTAERIARFRAFSEHVWTAAAARRRRHPKKLNVAFAVNMAQNMYKWASLATKYGADATLYLHPQDHSALSRPEWEEFDGEFHGVLDGPGFLRAHPRLPVKVPCVEPANEGSELLTAYAQGPDSPQAVALRRRTPKLRHQALLGLQGMYPYFPWAEALSGHDVIYIASSPFAAFASGKPYCVFSVGGDLQFDCGRIDDLGRAMRMAFRSAHFILASNPHTLGHCRRFGLTNALYLPYPMDSETYAPGPGTARTEWMRRFGGDVFVLSSARLDRAVKGQTPEMKEALFRVARERPSVRFMFLGWGADVEQLKALAIDRGLGDRIVILPPAGKKRLIDYYRSCDIVLDQFVYGYFGATALEAASVGKPVIMKIRAEQYVPLYKNDLAPVEHADSPEQVRTTLLGLIDSAHRRQQRGRLMRAWLVRNHGEKKTVRLLLALLQFAAQNARVSAAWDNPLNDPLSKEERDYHEKCRRDG